MSDLESLLKEAEHAGADVQKAVGDLYCNGMEPFQLRHGRTVASPDWPAALKWYRLAAGQGSADAMHSIGQCYLSGFGVKEDHAEAARWFRLAAENGSAEAKMRLAQCFEEGDGVRRDRAASSKWYRKAAEQLRK